jgi:hypothetical protein
LEVEAGELFETNLNNIVKSSQNNNDKKNGINPELISGDWKRVL